MKYRDRLKQIDAEISKLREARKKLVQHNIKRCVHPKDLIVELPYVPARGHVLAQKPWLLCTKCGLTEEGWGSGYKELRHADHLPSVRKVVIDEWNELRTCTVFQDGRIVWS